MKRTPLNNVASVTKAEEEDTKRRSVLSQQDVPSYSLKDALRVGRAIFEQYAGKPSTPLQVASAMELSPSSGGFRMLCGASIAYGITEGGYNAKEISLTSLGLKIFAPLEEGEDLLAKRVALLKPTVVNQFLTKYNGAALPRDDIAINVLRSFNVPVDRTNDAYKLIINGAGEVGFLRTIKDKQYVDLSGTDEQVNIESEDSKAAEQQEVPAGLNTQPVNLSANIQTNSTASATVALKTENKRVFITHGKNTAFIEPIKSLLVFGEFQPVISIEKQSVSQPVPDKVMNDMRSCSAAIIHVDNDMTLMDSNAKEHSVINPNVLIEIGAAMALFDRRFILLVKNGVQLPSNLQGLYEVRYDGDTLDGMTTLKLLKAISEIKNNPIPERPN